MQELARASQDAETIKALGEVPRNLGIVRIFRPLRLLAARGAVPHNLRMVRILPPYRSPKRAGAVPRNLGMMCITTPLSAMPTRRCSSPQSGDDVHRV